MDEYQLEIAGITFSITSPYPIDPNSIREIYRPFFKKGALANSHPDIDIHFVFDDFPYARSDKEVFDSGQSWSMLQDQGEYHIHFDPRQDGTDPYWQARFNANCTEATIHCSEELVLQVEDQRRIKNPLQYPLDQLLIVYHIASRQGALIHAAGAVINGRGLIFPGRSGAGKSTISKQLAKGEGDFNLVSDDRVIIRQINDSFMMFGTPWPGEAGIAKNSSHLLHGIAFIHHGTKNEIKEIDPKKALQQLLPVVSIPWYDQAIMQLIVDFCEGLVTSIPTYGLHFKPDVEIAGFLEDFLKESSAI